MSLLLAPCAAVALPQGKEPPKRLRVLPRAEVVRGKDGRAWKLGDVSKLLQALNAAGPVLLDEDHASVKGKAARAAGWLSDFQLTAEGIEAAIEWTPIGEELFSKKAYRYLSPTLHYNTAGATSDTLGTIVGLHSVGLVNTPNLDGLTALNSQTDSMNEEQIKALAAALTAAIQSGFAAIESKLAPAAAPAPAANSADAIKVAVNAVVDAAVAQGKIAPASKDAYVAMGGNSPESLELLKGLVKDLPTIVASNSQGAPKPENKTETKTLDKVDALIVKQLGISEDAYRAAKGELNG